MELFKGLFDLIENMNIKTFSIDYKSIFFNPLKSIINNNNNTKLDNKDIIPYFNKINNGYLKTNAFIEIFTILFKNHFSKYIYSHQKDKKVINLLKSIKEYKQLDNDILIFYNTLKNVTDKIVSITNGDIKTIITNIFKKSKSNLKTLFKGVINMKCDDKVDKDFYLFSKKENICKMIVNTELYTILFHNLANSLLYDTEEYNNIINGKYFIPISEITLLKKDINLYHNLYETDFNTNIILNKEEMEYMYKEILYQNIKNSNLLKIVLI